LRNVRAQGWAMDDEEYLPGFRCVGAPVYDYRGDAIACISVSGSKEQLSDARLPVIIQKVRESAMLVSKRMGYALQ
ncbi:MAG: IclR family transcriptional regulator C-terminal domain-containing protein, partial [Eubacteriales bacterium]|nr:IclR family transcriptional regulator C-terminal domain-containing protein [Eubacteriales bacterium]